MPRQFKVTVNGREYEVSVLELTSGQAAPPAPRRQLLRHLDQSRRLPARATSSREWVAS